MLETLHEGSWASEVCDTVALHSNSTNDAAMRHGNHKAPTPNGRQLLRSLKGSGILYGIKPASGSAAIAFGSGLPLTGHFTYEACNFPLGHVCRATVGGALSEVITISCVGEICACYCWAKDG